MGQGLRTLPLKVLSIHFNYIVSKPVSSVSNFSPNRNHPNRNLTNLFSFSVTLMVKKKSDVECLYSFGVDAVCERKRLESNKNVKVGKIRSSCLCDAARKCFDLSLLQLLDQAPFLFDYAQIGLLTCPISCRIIPANGLRDSFVLIGPSTE